MKMPMPPPRVLLVDDDQDTRDMYAWALSSRGFEVSTAGTPINALAEAGAAPPDIVVSDFTLPGMTGLDLASRLHEVPETSVPVILVSGHDFGARDREQVLRVCDRILLKPILPDRLGDEILRCLAVATSRRLRERLNDLRRRLTPLLEQSLSGQDAAARVLAAAQEALRSLRRAPAILVADDDARYLAVSGTFCDITGLSEAQLVQRTVWDLTPGIQVQAGRRMWQEFIARGSMEGTYSIATSSEGELTAWFAAEANVLPHVHVSLLAPVPAGVDPPPQTA